MRARSTRVLGSRVRPPQQSAPSAQLAHAPSPPISHEAVGAVPARSVGSLALPFNTRLHADERNSRPASPTSFLRSRVSRINVGQTGRIRIRDVTTVAPGPKLLLRSSAMDQLLLVLDLDETLVHAADERLSRPPDFDSYKYAVYKRPHLDPFLDAILQRYRVGIWTSSGRLYAEDVVSKLLDPNRLEFLWCAERTTLRFNHETRASDPVKKLRKLRRKGYALERIIVVDDSPEKHVLNYGNLVQVRPYEGSSQDDELVVLLRYLRQVESHPNVRSIEKRWWRDQVT